MLDSLLDKIRGDYKPFILFKKQMKEQSKFSYVLNLTVYIIVTLQTVTNFFDGDLINKKKLAMAIKIEFIKHLFSIKLLF